MSHNFSVFKLYESSKPNYLAITKYQRVYLPRSSNGFVNQICSYFNQNNSSRSIECSISCMVFQIFIRILISALFACSWDYDFQHRILSVSHAFLGMTVMSSFAKKLSRLTVVETTCYYYCQYHTLIIFNFSQK